MTNPPDLDRKTLWRIVALLLSLAALAERAAARPLVMRLVVSWILRRAELCARTLFGTPTEAFEAEMPAMPPRSGCGMQPCELLRLAASFRAMAALLALAGWSASGSGLGHAGRNASPRGFARHVTPVRVYDTS